jgi:DNA modification methylase
MDLRCGDCSTVLEHIDEGTVDAIITDPPYGLRFMGNRWDCEVPSVSVWRQCLRLLKPGGYLLSFAGTRTHHRMACSVEDAGFEIRDMIAWTYGQGFPKSLDVGKAIDKEFRGSDKATWAGWGTSLKPAFEPITVARKPLEGTVANNVLTHGTGAMNIDACRVGEEEVTINTWNDGAKPFGGGAGHEYSGRTVVGRWPANFMHDGSSEVLSCFPEATVSRFFYCAKANKKERGEGNNHPTVKPVKLLRYLVRLVTPPRGTVLDPFMGSGSTGIAALAEGMKFVGIEISPEYFEIAIRRLSR